jgi:hypothetical protein
VCPQHDILWNELTAREHLRIFAQLKGVTSGRVNAEINEKLEMVGLIKTGDHRVGTYSGGMKRRLSVAIASIGEPKVLLFIYYLFYKYIFLNFTNIFILFLAFGINYLFYRLSSWTSQYQTENKSIK